MLAELGRFAAALREAGTGPSPAAVALAAEALQVIDVTDRETVRLAWRACLASDPAGLVAFDQLFDTWFSFPWPAGPPGRPKRQRRNRPAGGGGSPRAGVPGRGESPRGTGRGTPPQPPQEMPGPAGRATAPTSGEGRGGAASPSPLRSDSDAPGRPSGCRDEATPGRVTALDAAEAQELARQRQQQATARARLRRQEQQARSPARVELRRRPGPAELAGLEAEVARLGRQLRTDYGRRWRQAIRGRIDLRATLAAAARTGGVPWRVVRRQRRITRQRVVVLCDVSGSTIRSARFLLALLAEIHHRFDRVDPFVFVDRPVPAGGLFAPRRRLTGPEGTARLERLPGLDLQALSDYGHTFIQLLAEAPGLLHPRATLLVLGDARCNQFDPQVWALEEIAGRVQQILWLNPERPDRWYTHDSRLREYEPYLTHLLPAATLADLAAGLARCQAVSGPG